VTPDGDIASIDSTSFHLLHNFGATGWEGGDLVIGDLDHGTGSDGQDLYYAGGTTRTVWDIEYDGGSVTSGASYSYYAMIDNDDTPGDIPEAFTPHRLAIGGDMDGDGNKELVVQSVNHLSQFPTMYVVEWGATGAGEAPNVPQSYSLNQNYPNPFNPQATIRYDLPESGHVTLRIYNSLGQEVRTLVDRVQGSGSHDALWNGQDNSGSAVSSGVYSYQIEVNDFKMAKKMVLLK
jgi:hypothetical protein